MVFPVIVYGRESWTMKKAECRRIDAFELWCWRRFLRVPWTARRSKLSILKEISPDYSLEELMLKLKLHYVGHLMWRTGSFEKTVILGKIEGRKKGTREDEMVGWHHWLNGHDFEQAPGVGDGQGSLACCSAWGCKELDMTEQLNWIGQFSTKTAQDQLYPRFLSLLQLKICSQIWYHPLSHEDMWLFMFNVQRPSLQSSVLRVGLSTTTMSLERSKGVGECRGPAPAGSRGTLRMTA